MSEPTGRREELDRLIERARADLREWADSGEHDPGVSAIELLSYVGDLIAAYQERIADEAYLATPGRRAGIRVDVDGEGWQEVSDLLDSKADDAHFVVATQDNGATVIQFGDGEHGRRPSTGSDIQVRYRSGLGHRFTSVLLQEGRVVIDADWNEATGTEICGIYRAVVVDNVDPLQKRRLRVLIPDVTWDESVWAMACLPAGDTDTVPSMGDAIWVAFESGDPERPVWLGRLFT